MKPTEPEETEELAVGAEHPASLRTFAASVAHQLNNPLGSILLAAQYALARRHHPGG